MKKKMLCAVFAAFMALSMTACGGDSGSTAADNGASSSGAANTSESSDNAAGSFVNNVFENSDVKIEITDYKVIPVGEVGNEYGEKPVIAFWYNVTNISGTETDPNSAWIFNLKAIQDNDPNAINELEVGLLPDDAFLDSQTQTIKQGGTVANAVAYELDDTTTPVILVAEDIIFGEIGRQEFQIAEYKFPRIPG